MCSPTLEHEPGSRKVGKAIDEVGVQDVNGSKLLCFLKNPFFAISLRFHDDVIVVYLLKKVTSRVSVTETFTKLG